jgi:anti-anti-sigma factor
MTALPDEPAEDATAVIEVDGPLDMSSEQGLRLAVRSELARGATAFVIDLSGSPFIDSTAMAALLGVNDELGERGIPLLVVIPSEPPERRRLVALAGLELALVIFESRTEALATLEVEGLPMPPIRRRELHL